jgi:hypothetical protein
MPNSVIENWYEVYAFLATQPICQWAAQKKWNLLLDSAMAQGNSCLIMHRRKTITLNLPPLYLPWRKECLIGNQPTIIGGHFHRIR